MRCGDAIAKANTMRKKRAPIHPGAILLEDVLNWMSLRTHYDLEPWKDVLGDRLARESVSSAKKVRPERSEQEK